MPATSEAPDPGPYPSASSSPTSAVEAVEAYVPTKRTARIAATLRRARNYAGPERETLLLVGKSAVAATAAWAAAQFLDAQSPAFAPFAAIMIIQVSVRESVTRSLRFVAAAVLGVSLQGMLGFFFAPNLLTFFAVAVVALLLGRWRRLEQQGSLVTTSALFAYSVFVTSDGTVDRVGVLAELIGLVLLGCAIGLAVNTVLLPPMRYRSAQYGLKSVASALYDLLGDMVESMRDGALNGREGDDWAYRARSIETLGRQAQDAVASAQEAMRWNPRRLLNRRRSPLAGYSHLIGDVASTGERLRSVTDILRRISDTSDTAQMGFLQRYGEFLGRIRTGVNMLSDLTPGRLGEVQAQFDENIAQAREIHDEMTRMESPGRDSDSGHGNLGDARIYGGLLVEAERMLLEMEAAQEVLAQAPSWTRAG